MTELPPFHDAARGLRDFLVSSGHPGEIAWAERRDYYSIEPDQHRVRWPLPNDVGAVEKDYEVARGRGIVALEAIFYVGQVSVVILDAPDPNEIQGWSQGLKLCIRQPFVAADPIPTHDWAGHECSKQYRRFQAFWRELPEYRHLPQAQS